LLALGESHYVFAGIGNENAWWFGWPHRLTEHNASARKVEVGS
jgi:hypothetical protein